MLFKKIKKGFTLVELVVVIAVIAILTGASVGAYFGITRKAEESVVQQEVTQLVQDIQLKTITDNNEPTLGIKAQLKKDNLIFNISDDAYVDFRFYHSYLTNLCSDSGIVSIQELPETIVWSELSSTFLGFKVVDNAISEFAYMCSNKLIASVKFDKSYTIIDSSYLNSDNYTYYISETDGIKEPTLPEGESLLCYSKISGLKYKTIESAISSARNGDNIIVYPGTTLNHSNDLIIKSGTTLSLPFENEDIHKYLSTAKANEVVSTINMTNGADIIIEEGGTLNIGAQLVTKSLGGKYCLINLDKESSITVNGNLNLYGKLAEVNAVTTKLNSNKLSTANSSDGNRFLKISKTGKLTTPLFAYDLGSGSVINDKLNANICPTNNFEFSNIGTYCSVEYGGEINVCLSVKGYEATAGLIKPISKQETEKALFYLEDGEISLEYYNTSKTVINIDGSIKLGSLYIDAGVTSIDSDNFLIPIHERFKIYINGSFDTNGKSLKFLPGSYLKVNEGGKFLISGTSEKDSMCVFYDDTTLYNIGASTVVQKPATFINNGLLSVNEYGKLGGNIQTDSTNNGAVIDLSKVQDQNNFAITTNELVGGKSVNISKIYLTGNVSSSTEENPNDNMNVGFKAGKIIISDPNTQKWICDDYLRFFNISLSTNETNYINSAFRYLVYINNIAESIDGAELINGNNPTAKNLNFTVIQDSYVKIELQYGESVSCNNIELNSDNWTRIESDTSFTIQPEKGYKVTVYHSNGSSGAGTIERSVIYGSSKDSLEYTIGVSNGGKVEVIFPCNWFFRVEDDSNVKGTSIVTKTTYDENNNPTSSVISETTGKIAWDTNEIFVLDGDYVFHSDNVSCIVEGTKVSMANGLMKNVEDLKVGDIVKVFDHSTGKVGYSEVIINFHEGQLCKNTEVINVKLNTGEVMRIVDEHLFFDANSRTYFPINSNTYNNVIGRTIVGINTNDNLINKTIVDAHITIEDVKVFSPITYKHLNFFSDGMLSAAGNLNGLFNIFELDEEYKINSTMMADDIETYGLFTYEEWKDRLSPEEFDAFNVKYLKVSIGKGLCTLDELYSYIDNFLR